ncbi:hypothetical protein [Enterovirga sp.]|uniref:hypothetical protein n=1 Tax=Enterovirga sp. TaxID=2026350 RepID=UPI002C8FA054|nr:hypothetical protein [Enterovirga sp.]HMO30901.1 hypothetical protein [Enterovirga sp.]
MWKADTGRGGLWPLLLALALLSGAPARAAGPCTPPVPPDPAGRPEKPVPPAKSPCVDAPTKAGCLGWEAYRFNDEVKAYNAKVPAFQKAANAYVAQLNAYVAAAGAYAKCEVESLH